MHWLTYVPPTTVEPVEERALGASFISSQLSAVITGASVILAALGAFIALKNGTMDFQLRYSLFLSALWAVFALGIALYAFGVLPHHAPKTNIVRVKGVAMLCSAALFFSLAAGFRFMWGGGLDCCFHSPVFKLAKQLLADFQPF